MKHWSKKWIFIAVPIFLFVGLIFILNLRLWKSPTTSDFNFLMQPYGDRKNVYYLAEDYMAEGSVSMEKGYYEAVNIIKGSEYRIFIPINPQTFERLPSEQYMDGTTIEVEGDRYIIHVQDNNYSATLYE